MLTLTAWHLKDMATELIYDLHMLGKRCVIDGLTQGQNL